MSMIPTSGRKPDPFVPTSLRGIEGAPSFLMKTSTVETKIELSARLVERGITAYQANEIRNAYLAGLKANVSEEDYETHSNRLIAYWDQMDAHKDAQSETAFEDCVDFVHDDDGYVEEIEGKIAEHWPEVRRMNASNYRYNQYSPIVRLSLMLAGWTGLPTAYSTGLDGVSLEQISVVAEELSDFETANNLPVGLAWIELKNEATMRVHLTETQRKNFASLSPSPSPPIVSESDLAAEPAGTSTALEVLHPVTIQPDMSPNTTENS